MSSSNLHYDRIKQIIDFFLIANLTSSQRSSLISNLLHYEKLTGLHLIDNGDAILTILEQDFRSLHVPSASTSLFLPDQGRLDQSNHQHRACPLLHAQSSSILRTLQDDLAILHGTSAAPRQEGRIKIRRARSSSSSVKVINASEVSRANELRERRRQNEVGLPDGTLTTGASRIPVIKYQSCLAHAPPLSGSTDHESRPYKKRPLAADFFVSDPASERTFVDTGAEVDSGGDVTELIEEEKANVRNMEKRKAEHHNITHGDTLIEYESAKEPMDVDSSTSSSLVRGQGSDNETSMRSPIGVFLRPQGDNMTTNSSFAQDIAACSESGPRAPDAEERIALRDRKWKQSPVNCSERKKSGFAAAERKPEVSLVTPSGLPSFQPMANGVTGGPKHRTAVSERSSRPPNTWNRVPQSGIRPD
ncbi:MAG: hypothetical protein LQ337_008111 [Flavoplaca oasis]|nr:MAG: hypothetical protein LQ337_008111 [Flavoplaca oasis]